MALEPDLVLLLGDVGVAQVGPEIGVPVMRPGAGRPLVAAARRKPGKEQLQAALEWGWAWPAWT